MIIRAWAENMSKRVPSQTPDHSFVGHLHPTHFLFYPVTAPQKDVFFTKVTKKKTFYFSATQRHQSLLLWIWSIPHVTGVLIFFSNIFFHPKNTSEGEVPQDDFTNKKQENLFYSLLMTSMSKNKGVKFFIPSWVSRIESCRKSLTYEHSEKNTNIIIFYTFRYSLHKIYTLFT